MDPTEGVDETSGGSTPSLTSEGVGTSEGSTSEAEASDSTSTPMESSGEASDVANESEGETEASESTGSEPTGTPVLATFGERTSANYRETTSDTFVSVVQQDLSFSAHADIHVTGANEDSSEVGLIRFDVVALSGRVIVDAELWLQPIVVTREGTLDLYGISESWATDPVDGTPGLPNWNQRTDQNSWIDPGLLGNSSSEVDPFATMTLLPGDVNTDVIVEIPPERIAAWAEIPEENHGFILVTDHAAVQLASCNFADEGVRPLLRVTYLD